MQSMVISKKQWFLIGVTTGMVVSLVVMPFIEDCHQMKDSMDNYNHNWYSLIVNNDFNPVLRLNQTKSQIHFNQRVFRPKYFSTELEVKDNLLICVQMSLNSKNVFSFENYLLNETIKQFSDKVMVFYEDSKTSPSDQQFKGYSDSVITLNTGSPEVPLMETKSKPNQHIFALPFISDHNYRQLDPNPLNSDQLLDSGVIFSSSLLLKCNLDVNCLNEFRNEYQNQLKTKFISYKLNSNLNYEEFNENILNFQTLYSSLTVFPVKDINIYNKLNLFLCQKLINETNDSLKSIEKQIITSNNNESALEWPIGSEPPLKATNRFEVIRWSYFNESHSLMSNDFDVSLPLNAIQSTELSQIKSETIVWLQNKYQNLLTEEEFKIINFYKKFDAIRGMEYLIDFQLSAFQDIKRLHVIKPLNRIELIPDVPYVTENVRIVIILTIKSDKEIESTSDFLSQYTNVCLKKSTHRTVLIMVLMHRNNDKTDQYLRIKEEATQLQTKYKNSGAKIAWIPIHSVEDHRVPTELAYFDILVKKLSQSFSDALLLHCRPNMILSMDYLNRIRLNTIQSNEVFFPIPFVEYRLRSQLKPLKTFDVRKDNGYFDSTNYNHFSFYLSDYIKARKVSQNILPIVKNQQFLKRSIYYGSDIDVFNLFINYNKQMNNKLFIMRAIEPELKLKHQSFNYECFSYETNKYSIENCLKRALIGLGSRPQLAALVIEDNKKEGENANVFSK